MTEWTFELVEKSYGTVYEPHEKVEIPLTDAEFSRLVLFGEPLERNGVWAMFPFGAIR